MKDDTIKRLLQQAGFRNHDVSPYLVVASMDNCRNLIRITRDPAVKLLSKYIKHVQDCEGVDYIDRCNSGGPCDQAFNDVEIALLRELAK